MRADFAIVKVCVTRSTYDSSALHIYLNVCGPLALIMSAHRTYQKLLWLIRAIGQLKSEQPYPG